MKTLNSSLAISKHSIPTPAPMKMKSLLNILPLLLAGCFAATTLHAGSPPVVSAVTAAQRPSNDAHPKYVDVSYTISDANFTNVNVYLLASTDSGSNWNQVIPNTFDFGSSIGKVIVTTNGTTKTITWDAGADWDGHYTSRCRVRVLANNLGLVLIPEGIFLRGDSYTLPVNQLYSVYVQAFYVDETLVSGGFWSIVKSFADTSGYTFTNTGYFKAPTHPVQNVNWFDAIKWCNARSEREGLTPVYYNETNYSTVYKTGENIPIVKLTANGYRLPTETEWEKAARFNSTVTLLNNHLFAHSPFTTCSDSTANYNGTSGSGNSSGSGFNIHFSTGGYPYTSPVDYFSPTRGGLFDMGGNVRQWCWDWTDSYPDYMTTPNPQGPISGAYRVVRGGSWNESQVYMYCGFRNYTTPENADNYTGFRCVRGL